MKATTMLPLHKRICTCPTCHASHAWNWEEAFLDEGFFSGDDSYTEQVAGMLRNAGYAVSTGQADKNEVIISIRKGSQPLLPPDFDPGLLDPRGYLPSEIIQLLDDAFPSKATDESLAS